MHITTIGLDLAKEVFQVHVADAQGKTVLRKQLRRSESPRFSWRLFDQSKTVSADFIAICR
ncbi:hypothetical protein NTGZN8_120014 [Candidatus Nitrotoga fabula]|uniref:Transposase n=1 Tax=Candidatus Nitrotoga fabula TaxID=2182327 RepID=A0A916BC02_9PROT|nr:hypothetical protein NTGZN8_120014 [Candidatus Nitrotoga fabula]